MPRYGIEAAIVKITSNRGQPNKTMKLPFNRFQNQKSIAGRISLVLLWLLGVPVPILIIIFLFRGCSG